MHKRTMATQNVKQIGRLVCGSIDRQANEYLAKVHVADIKQPVNDVTGETHKIPFSHAMHREPPRWNRSSKP